MHLSRQQLIQLADAYRGALAGGDVLGALRLHADKAGVKLDHVNLVGLERLVVYNVMRAANAQNKLEAMLSAAQEDGIYVVISDSAPPHAALESQFPRLWITRYASYLPTSVVLDDPRFRLLEGRILNPKPVIQRVFLQASVAGAADVVKVDVDVPPTGTDIPRLRMPRFTREEAEQLTQTVVPAALNVELYVPGIHAPVDSFQRDVWLSQPNVVLIARQGEGGQFEDYTSVLAWWVNSGAAGLVDFLAQALPLEMCQNMGYPASRVGSTEIVSPDYVDRQVRALYEGLQQLSLTFMPTELIWIAGETELLQRVRRPEEVLSDLQRRVNCLDGAILFASLLEYMGLDPILVLVPHHALAGWKRQSVLIDPSDPAKVWQTCSFLDTTLLSTGLGFDAAVSAAQGYFLKAQHQFSRKSGPLTEFARIIDIKAARGLPPSGIVDRATRSRG